MIYKNEKGCGFCDQIIIHNYPNSTMPVKAQANFKRDGKIINTAVMADVESILAYMARQPFCDGVPYRVITHK